MSELANACGVSRNRGFGHRPCESGVDKLDDVVGLDSALLVSLRGSWCLMSSGRVNSRLLIAWTAIERAECILY